jgi:lysophospholipase L1-like esterase
MSRPAALVRHVLALLLRLLLGGCAGQAPAGSEAEHQAGSDPGSATTEADPPTSVTFIGDSWTYGVGATTGHGYVDRVAGQLGWDYENLGISGTGYVAPAGDGPFRERIGRAVAGHPDVIVVQGSLNDQAVDPATLAAQALDTLTQLHEQADPDTEILVMGASYTPGTTDAAIDAVNGAVGGAAEAVGLPFADPAQENWTDRHDPEVWADSLHPDDTGHQRLADGLAPLLEDLLDD